LPGVFNPASGIGPSNFRQVQVYRTRQARKSIKKIQAPPSCSLVVQSPDSRAAQFSTQDIHRVIVSRIHTLHVYHALAIIK
jgi:hypothetical protein